MHPLLKGFLVGLAAGAVVGLLLSPHKGTTNRDLVRQRIQQAVAAGQKAAQEQDERLRARYRQGIRPVEKESAQS